MASEPALQTTREHQPGDLIANRYVLSRKLGEGGMGVVWVAHSTALDVDVALKMLRPELAGTPAVERMAREARAAAQLGHAAMVRVLDFGTSDDGEPFLAMELLQGEELHARIEREQRLPAASAVALLLPILDGLGIAHEKGIVHRDIKPENIFIAVDSQKRVQPKVLDFGIAKLGREQTVSRLTQVGAVMGSPYYLSPEQAEGLDDIDFRCDIWSIGVVLYEAVTGVPPFAANNYNALMRSILRDQPKPTTEHAAGDAQLWMIIHRCLQKDREQRWGSMWELGEALALWLFERGVRVDAAGRSLRHAWLDSAITGVQILVSSELPSNETPTLPPPLLPIAEVATTPRREPQPSSLASTEVRPRRRRRGRLMVLLAVGFAALGGLGAFALVRSKGQAPPAPSAQAEVRAAAAVTHPVVATTGTPTPAEPLQPQLAPTAAVPSGSEAAPAPSESAPTSPPPRPVRAKPKPGAASATGRSGGASRRSEEFGF
ncbi:MAG: serine/threonine protein kinase [Myxococcales bacterium]|nr:MAG: serine/threonine protein kinase [Myxococcales bacterium]